MTCSIIRITLYYIMSMYRLHALSFYILIIILNIAAVFENITCEYILVVSSKEENKRKNTHNSNHLPIFFGFRALGSLIGSFFGGRIIE